MALVSFEQIRRIVSEVQGRGIDVSIFTDYKTWQALFKLWQYVQQCLNEGRSFNECKYFTYEMLAMKGLAFEPYLIAKFANAGLLKLQYASRRYKIWEINLNNFNELEALVRWFNPHESLPGEKTSIFEETPEDLEEWRKLIPQDLFESIVGYDDVKEFIKMSLMSNEPVHCLFVGPPGTAKSIPKETELIVKIGNEVKVIEVSELHKLFTNGVRNIEVLSVDPYILKTCWKKVLGVAKIFESRPLVRIVLENGLEVTCTTDHSLLFLDSISKILKPIKASVLQVGDYLPILVNVPKEVKEITYNSSTNVTKIINDVGFCKIVKIEEIEFTGFVYDLMVDETENFVGSNLVPYHNTLFLLELSRIPGSKYVTADQVTSAGLRDLLMTERPRILLIDEIDKMRKIQDISALLEWMERGTVTKLQSIKYGGYQIIKGKGWVFAAANRIEKLPKELVSRFEVFYFDEYTPEEYIEVATKYVSKTYNIPEDIAKVIAEECAKRTRDIRRAINIAKLIQRHVQEGKNKNEIIKTIKKIIAIKDKYTYRKHEFYIDSTW